MAWCAVVVLLLAVPLTLSSAQSEGDVRLAEGPTSNIGRLEIFWQGKWSTFCGLTSGGAQTACRQLGFLDFVSYKALENVNRSLNIPEASPETPIAIYNTECNRSFANGLYHILRCGYNTILAPDCHHKNDIVLQCQTTSLWTHPYSTQVRLTDDMYSSSGILEIFIDGEWGNVCGNSFTSTSADSACRQMGYTNALTFSLSPDASTNTTWLDKVSCGVNSCDCLSGCLGGIPTTPTVCPEELFVEVKCTYDVTIDEKASSGNRDICENRESSCTNPAGPGTGHGRLSSGGVAAIVIGLLLVIGVVVIVAFILVLWLPRWRKRDYANI